MDWLGAGRDLDTWLNCLGDDRDRKYYLRYDTWKHIKLPAPNLDGCGVRRVKRTRGANKHCGATKTFSPTPQRYKGQVTIFNLSEHVNFINYFQNLVIY